MVNCLDYLNSISLHKDIFINIKIIKEKFYSILLMSITSISIFNSVVYYSLNFTQVLNGALMISTIPVLIIFISFIFRVEKINLNQVLGLILSITGVVIIITQLEFSRLIHLDLNKGDLWLLSCNVIMGYLFNYA